MRVIYTTYYDQNLHIMPAELVAHHLGVSLTDLIIASRRATPPIKRRGSTQWVHWPRDASEPDLRAKLGIQIEEGQFRELKTKYRHIFIVKRHGKYTRRVHKKPIYDLWIEEP